MAWTLTRKGSCILVMAGLAALFSCGGIARATNLTVIKIAEDPFSQASCAASATTNHKAIAEPDSFSHGSTIVAAYQVGRIYDGGACAIGYAVSTDNGAHWSSGLLPGLTTHTAPNAGPYDRVTDAAVAYDARHDAWLISSLVLTESGGIKAAAILTSVSTDGGSTWSTPYTTSSTSNDPDKNWIVCDNTSTSNYYGTCYTQWDDHGSGNKLFMSTSTNGGVSWSAPLSNNAGVIGGQPVVRPDGTVIVPTANANETAIGAFYSSNGGASWSSVTTISTVKHHAVAGSLREGPLPSAEVDANGQVYVAWADCRFRRSCKANDIVMAYSVDAFGKKWSKIIRVPIDGVTSGVDHFIPGLAVNAATAGSTAQLGLTYYYYPSGTTDLMVGFVSSSDGGATWTIPQTTLSSYPSRQAATTSQGRMVGDYISTSFGSDNLAHGIVVIPGALDTGTSCSTSALDNCNAYAATFTGSAAPSTVAVVNNPVLFSGNGAAKAQSYWNIVNNNGIRHRD